MEKKIKSVSIKIKPGAYKMYRHMSNKPWYAIAEYIDNAIQSYISNKSELKKVNGKHYKLIIEVNCNYTDDIITIKDNAAGIDTNNFNRAFEPANIPEDATGLSEFGMGLKIASIWLSDCYSVRSSALGEDIERLVTFDLKKVIKQQKEELEVESKKVNPSTHYSVITLKGLSKNAPKKGNQLIKVKNHISSIYRKFISSGDLEIIFDKEILTYNEPEILFSPYFKKNKEGDEPILWRKNINFKTDRYMVSGFIALQKIMQASKSGISLFRRGRIIQGSHDEKYHPRSLCGSPGSPRDKRLFGDLELKGFDVDFAKGSFTNMEDLEIILEKIKDDLNKDERNILRQGDHYRKKPPKKEIEVIAKSLEKEFKKKI